MYMDEMALFIFFDISDTKLRNRVNEKCKDYGLSRIQLSGFSGRLNRAMRLRLIEELKELIGSHPAVLYLQPVCSSCKGLACLIENRPKREEKPKGLYFGMPLNRAYLNSED